MKETGHAFEEVTQKNGPCCQGCCSHTPAKGCYWLIDHNNLLKSGFYWV
jgi:hypothetical protein